jgi:hypothetical protein
MHFLYSVYYELTASTCFELWGRRGVCTGCWWGNLRERSHWGDPDVHEKIILRRIFRKLEGVVGNGWSWLRIGIGGRHL